MWCGVCSREMSKGLKDLLKGLLERKVADRTGSREDDAQELFQSEFLSSLDMDRVIAKDYAPEFVPPAQRHETDVRNFEREFTDERVRIIYLFCCCG
jgi:serine/threonine protein kinase